MNLLKALATVSSLTMVSRVLGFLRDAVVARTLGAGLVTYAFFVAFKIPNLLRRMFAEGAFSQAFVPMLAEYKAKNEPGATRELIDATASFLFVLLVLLSLVGVLAAAAVVLVSAPGFFAQPEKFELTVLLTRFCFPYIFFISLVALASGILNTWGRFAVPAVAPALLNVSFIACALWLAPHLQQPVLALAIAVLIGGALQLAALWLALSRLGLIPRWRWDPRHSGLRRIMRLMLPALLGVSVVQLSLLLNTLFASFVGDGGVSWLYYADRLMEFPAGMLGAALGTILLPSLARRHAEADGAAYSQLVDWGLRLVLLLTAPAAAALALLSIPLVATLFHYGAFSNYDVWMTRQALIAYAVGLFGMIAVKVLAPSFYARQNLTTPVRIAVITLIATQLMNLLFYWPLRHAGLALSIGLGACLNAYLLLRALRHSDAYRPAPGWGRFVAQVLASLVLMCLVLWFAMGSEASWLHGGGARVWRLTGLVLLGAVTYLGCLGLLGVRPRQFMRREPE